MTHRRAGHFGQQPAPDPRRSKRLRFGPITTSPGSRRLALELRSRAVKTGAASTVTSTP